jgi:hypothetical protein
MIVLPIYSVKETKTNNCLSVLTKQDWHHEGEELVCYFPAMVDVDRLCYVHTPGMGKEEALEGQVK